MVADHYPQELPSARDDVLISAAGCVLLVVGIFCIISQILTPTTLLGSMSYTMAGCSILMYSSFKVRSVVYSCLPVVLRELLFEKTILDSLSHSSIFCKLAAFALASAALPSRDVDDLATCLPRQFDTIKRASGIQLLTGSSLTKQSDTSLEVWNTPTCTKASLSLKELVKASVRSVVPTYCVDKFVLKLVELSARTIANRANKAVQSVVLLKTESLMNGIGAATRCDWEKWVATLGLVTTTSLCWWCSGLHNLPYKHYSRYLKDLLSQHGLSWLRQVEKSVAELSTDKAVVLGMGLLGGAAAAISAHSAVFRMSLDEEFAPHSLKRVLVSDKTTLPICTCTNSRNEQLSAARAAGVELVQLLLSRRQFISVHTLLHDLFDVRHEDGMVSGTSAVRRGACIELEPRLLFMCLFLVNVFMTRLNCKQRKCNWLVCVYYSKLSHLLKRKT